MLNEIENATFKKHCRVDKAGKNDQAMSKCQQKPVHSSEHKSQFGFIEFD
jgi:hypothetical protein